MSIHTVCYLIPLSVRWSMQVIYLILAWLDITAVARCEGASTCFCPVLTLITAQMSFRSPDRTFDLKGSWKAAKSQTGPIHDLDQTEMTTPCHLAPCTCAPSQPLSHRLHPNLHICLSKRLKCRLASPLMQTGRPKVLAGLAQGPSERPESLTCGLLSRASLRTWGRRGSARCCTQDSTWALSGATYQPTGACTRGSMRQTSSLCLVCRRRRARAPMVCGASAWLPPCGTLSVPLTSRLGHKGRAPNWAGSNMQPDR